jgi:nucleoside-diphosphate-sugar epimerase
MRVLVTGVAGHLGEALARTLAARGDEVVGLDLVPSVYASHVGSITDTTLVARCMRGVEAVFHLATLHKPHVASHDRRAFIDVNVAGTETLLAGAVGAGVSAFVFTSTTSVFGEAMSPAAGAPAVWVDEALPPRPRNIYGVTKLAAEQLCALARREDGLATIILRTSRFFPEADDDPAVRAAYAPDNVKLNEFLYRRADIEDVVQAHLLAADRAADVGPGPYIVSATTPFAPAHLARLATDAPSLLAGLCAAYGEVYAHRGWSMFPAIGRVYDNAAARAALGWTPKYDFVAMLEKVAAGAPPMSELALAIGAKGYHPGARSDKTTRSSV